jgi:UDP-MurNAc hydroxylase
MLITYLGHAGFCVETDKTIIVMDPWLSANGAFDSSWFQYPRNHDLADYVQKLLKETKKDKYIYISHDHQDHFDIDFLNSLENRDFTILLAKFERPVVRVILEKNHYQCQSIVSLGNNEEIVFADGHLTMYTIDAELECDSGVLVNFAGQTFLNINDCKLHSAVMPILEKEGKIDVFAAQYSGAIWYPTCYQMSETEYKKISMDRKRVKLELTSRTIEKINPSVFLPSAGPPCFLDPLLIDKNFELVNIFPRAPECIDFLNERCQAKATQWPDIMPGDCLDVGTLQFVKYAKQRVKDEAFKAYVKDYAEKYKDFFYQCSLENQQVDPQGVFQQLGKSLQHKLDQVTQSHDDIEVQLYWKLTDYDEMYCVNFQKKTIEIVSSIETSKPYWLIESPAWQVNKIFEKRLSWPDFALTFRMKITREPNCYNTFVHGFITLEATALKRFSQLLMDYHAKTERITVEANGEKYSIRRYCPHQGADLSAGWIEGDCIVCPRHRWKFCLKNKGKCVYNEETIDAIPLKKGK